MLFLFLRCYSTCRSEEASTTTHIVITASCTLHICDIYADTTNASNSNYCRSYNGIVTPYVPQLTCRCIL